MKRSEKNNWAETLRVI